MTKIDFISVGNPFKERAMLADKINKDYIQAMKDKDSVKSSTLSFLRAQLKYVMIDQKQEPLDDAQVIVVIKKQIKQRQDSISQYEKGGRQDLAAKEQQELVVLQSYLPQEMSEEQLQPIVAKAIAESGAASMKDMGKVMKLVAAEVAGRADNKMVSDLVKKLLSS